MTSSTPTSWTLPDVNVWLALFSSRHRHHIAASTWYLSLRPTPLLCFCRQTQLGFFRLLSNATVMQDAALDQRACWQIYDQWIDADQASLLGEPPGLDRILRSTTNDPIVAPKLWMDAYLAAFAQAGGLTLATFDRMLAERVKGSVLLG